MNLALPLVLISLFGLAGQASQSQKMKDARDDTKEVVGTWEGESICAIRDSPCHDEHSLYQIKNAGTGKVTIDGYKVVKGEQQFMATLECNYRASEKALSCTTPAPRDDDWEFKLSGTTMQGTLTAGPKKTLYRKVSLSKKK